MFFFINAMRDIFLLIVSNLVTIICISAATFLAFHSKEGWGWLLLIAAMFGVVQCKRK